MATTSRPDDRFIRDIAQVNAVLALAGMIFMQVQLLVSWKRFFRVLGMSRWVLGTDVLWAAVRSIGQLVVPDSRESIGSSTRYVTFSFTTAVSGMKYHKPQGRHISPAIAIFQPSFVQLGHLPAHHGSTTAELEWDSCIRRVSRQDHGKEF
jgi:hypothetical protein